MQPLTLVRRVRTDAAQVDGTRFLGLAARGRQLLDAGCAHEAANHLDLALAQWRGPALVEFQTEGVGLGYRRPADRDPGIPPSRTGSTPG
jgi:hypothetical protein